MNIFLTGARGFIGRHVTRRLLKEDHKVIGLDNKHSHKRWCKWVDITDLPRLESVFKNAQPIDAVIHLAAQPSLQASWKNAPRDANVNILGTINLLGLCQRYKVKRFVFASTSAVYAPKTTMPYMENDRIGPQTPYGVSKAAAERYIQISGLSYAILRLGNVYGPGQVPLGENQLIPRALAHIYQDEPFQINGDGEQSRDFVYVVDVARAFVKATEKSGMGIYNISKGRSFSVNFVVDQLWKIIHYPPLGLPSNLEILTPDFLYGPRKPSELRNIRLSSQLAKRSLEWKATTGIWKGLKKTIEAWPKP